MRYLSLLASVLPWFVLVLVAKIRANTSVDLTGWQKRTDRSLPWNIAEVDSADHLIDWDAVNRIEITSSSSSKDSKGNSKRKTKKKTALERHEANQREYHRIAAIRSGEKPARTEYQRYCRLAHKRTEQNLNDGEEVEYQRLLNEVRYKKNKHSTGDT